MNAQSTTIHEIEQLATSIWGAKVTVLHSTSLGVLVSDGCANNAAFLAHATPDPVQAALDYFRAERLLDGSPLADYGVQPESPEYWTR